mmetsp:Transcript_32100/g.84108  ORF Transcript_32100/g.84108 Transcript_32100/m.84108 type:complete len:244 (-) Transcript_32100:1230-1961(-)
MPCGKEECAVEDEQANRIQQDGEPREALHTVVLGRAALDGHIRLEPLAVAKRVAGESIKGHVGDEWVREEAELQQERHRRLEQRRDREAARAEQAKRDCEHNECCGRPRQQHVDSKRGAIAAHTKALEHSADAVDAEAHADRKGGEQLLDGGWQLDLVDAVNLGGEHVEADQDLELDVRCERPPCDAQLGLEGVGSAHAEASEDRNGQHGRTQEHADGKEDGVAGRVAALGATRLRRGRRRQV